MRELTFILLLLISVAARGELVHLSPRCQVMNNLITCELRNLSFHKLNCTFFSRIPSDYGEQTHSISNVHLFERETKIVENSVWALNKGFNYVSADAFCKKY